MGFQNNAIFHTLREFFLPNTNTDVEGRILKLLEDAGCRPEQLYVVDPSLDTEGFSSEDMQILRFFRVPMSPGYLMKNLLTPQVDILNALGRALKEERIKPVDGLPLQMSVDRDKWDFYRALDVSSPPSEVQLNITNRCVNRCRMCRKYEWDQIDMPVDKIREVVHDLKRMGTRLVMLSGGEPFLHRDIDEVLNMVADMTTLAFTSGCVPLSKERLRKLKRIQFSVDAVDPETYRFIRGPGSTEVIRNNILKAKDAGCHVTITAVMQKANILHVPDIIDFCEKENIPFLPSAVHSYDDLAFYNVSHRRLPPVCLVPFYHCLIDPQGDVFVCCHHHEDNTEYGQIDRKYVLGNVFDSGFPDIWSSDNAKNIKRSLYNNRAPFCQGCFRYLLENDAASFIRSCETSKEFPYIHTYFFPLEMMSRLRAEE